MEEEVGRREMEMVEVDVVEMEIVEVEVEMEEVEGGRKLLVRCCYFCCTVVIDHFD